MIFKKFVNKVQGAFNINKATLTGCIDVIVVEREDGSLHCSPFHVRFGKLKVLRTKQKTVNLIVNETNIGVTMKLGKGGEGYFEIEADLTDDDSEINSDNFGSDESDEESDEKKTEEKKKKSELEKTQKMSKRSRFMRKLNNVFSKSKPVERPLPQELNSSPKKEEVSNEKDDLLTEEKKNENKEEENENKEEENENNSQQIDNQVGLSLCKSLISMEMSDEDLIRVFDENRIDFDSFSQLPRECLTHPELMIRIHDSLYLPEDGIPQIISLLAYNRVLDENPEEKENFDIPDENELVVGENQQKSKKYLKKSLKPTQDILKKMKLRYGKNRIVYVVQGTMKEQIWAEADIFLLKSNTKIVISDIDGTITKSDVLGHIMPMMGRDWSHAGIADLFSNIKKNGYQMVYLTARAIGQSVKQGNTILPDGPLVMSPDRLFHAFKREIILKKPEVFKIAVLRDLVSLFGSKYPKPIITGFGNKDTDAIAYRAIGVSKAKIFIINPDSEIFQMNSTYKWSYNKLNELVNEIFPPVQQNEEENDPEFVDKNYFQKNQDVQVDESQIKNLMEEIAS